MSFNWFKLGKFQGIELCATSSDLGVKLHFQSPHIVTATESVSFESLRAAIERFIDNASQHDDCSLEPQIYWFNGCLEFDFGQSFVAIPCGSQDVPSLYEILKKFVAKYEKAA